MGGGGGNPTLSFPSNPNYGDTYTWNTTGDVWMWNGINWDLNGQRISNPELYNPKTTDLLAHTNQGGTGPYKIYSNITNESVEIANGSTSNLVDIANGSSFNGTVRIASGALSSSSGSAVQIASGTANQASPLVEIASGPSASGGIKVVNIGTAGVSGSTTTINVGSAESGSTTNIAVNGNVTLPYSVSIGEVGSEEIASLSGVTSNIQTQLSSLALPSQSGNSGKFLTTDGTTTSWAVAGGGGGGDITNPTFVFDINESSTTTVPLGAEVSVNDSGMGGGQFAFYNDNSSLVPGNVYTFVGTTYVDNNSVTQTIDNIPLTFVSRTFDGGYSAYFYYFTVVNSADEAQFGSYAYNSFYGITTFQIVTASTIEINETVEPLDAVNILKARTISDKTANYTITSNDFNNLIRSTGGAITITVANVLQPGQRIDFAQFGTGQITFAADAGVTLVSEGSKLKTAKQYSGATIECIGSGTYWLVGSLG